MSDGLEIYVTQSMFILKIVTVGYKTINRPSMVGYKTQFFNSSDKNILQKWGREWERERELGQVYRESIK